MRARQGVLQAKRDLRAKCFCAERTGRPREEKDEVGRLVSDVESQAGRIGSLGQDIARSAHLALGAFVDAASLGG